MKIPTLFGFPLWKGHFKKRVIKKHLKKVIGISQVVKSYGQQFANLKIGDLINDCTSFNTAIVDMSPQYSSVRGGQILRNIYFTTATGGCSLTNCGVEPELSRKEVEQRHLANMQNWFDSGYALQYYGSVNDPEYKKRFDEKEEATSILSQGGHITDERGRRL